ncbi:hypothetical protein FSP39_000714 [Pinctada imbricata]|uniref:G-protein coupled receptors family 1 profile domain-containing protein n=1 Tax=Pinctada imbricata TaxID=66713 RepID=A0AA88YVL7_PINIB|nr:hypothetical protein FSP39_000714 [Pinctada imbricata]
MGNGVVIFTAVILSVTGVANVLSLAFLLSRKKLRTQSNFYISSLILADLSLTSSMTLHYIDSAGFYTGLYTTEVGCSFLTYFELSFLAASTANIILISLDVRKAVMNAATYTQNPKEAIRRLVFAWLLSFIYGTRIFAQFAVTDSLQGATSEEDSSAENSTKIIVNDEEQSLKFCNLISEEETSDIYFRVVDLVCLFIAPIVVLFLIGYQILKYINDKTLNTDGRKDRKRRIQLRSVIGIAAFFICWSPFYLMDIITDAKEIIEGADDDDDDGVDVTTDSTRVAINFLANLHCFINLVIYAWLNKNFREQIAVVVTKCRGNQQNQVHIAPQ